MKCKACGTEFDEGVFCPECGTKCEGSELLDENAVQEALAIEREKVKTAVTEEAKKRIEDEKENIRKVVEQETRDMAVKEAKEAASKMVELENDAIKQEAIRLVKEEAIQKAKEEEEKRQQIDRDKTVEEEIKNKKRINNQAIRSFVFGIINWVILITIVPPIVLGIWSIIDGVKAVKNKTKHKAMAIIGIVLSAGALVYILFAVMIAILFM